MCLIVSMTTDSTQEPRLLDQKDVTLRTTNKKSCSRVITLSSMARAAVLNGILPNSVFSIHNIYKCLVNELHYGSDERIVVLRLEMLLFCVGHLELRALIVKNNYIHIYI